MVRTAGIVLCGGRSSRMGRAKAWLPFGDELMLPRVLRLQATIRAIDRGGESLAQLACDTGFSDQAHATRELQQLTGLTPARLRAALRSARDDDRTVQLAAAFVRGTANDRR